MNTEVDIKRHRGVWPPLPRSSSMIRHGTWQHRHWPFQIPRPWSEYLQESSSTRGPAPFRRDSSGGFEPAKTFPRQISSAASVIDSTATGTGMSLAACRSRDPINSQAHAVGTVPGLPKAKGNEISGRAACGRRALLLEIGNPWFQLPRWSECSRFATLGPLVIDVSRLIIGMK